MTPKDLARRLAAEALGTGLLVTMVVGSGIMASRLSPGDTGLQLLENSLATGLGLAVLILALGPVSGAHLNPVVTLALWANGDRTVDGIPRSWVAPYIAAQTVGAVAGAVLANLMFEVPQGVSETARSGGGVLLGEVVATAGLVALVLTLHRTHRTSLAAPAIGAYIAAAYWFTSSTSFANPAVTIGRALSDTFAGIDPASVPAFVVAQVAGAAAGLGIVAYLYPVRIPERSRP